MQEEAVAILESIQEKPTSAPKILRISKSLKSALEEQNAFTEKSVTFDHSSEDVMSFAVHISSRDARCKMHKDSVVKVLAAVAMLTGTELAGLAVMFEAMPSSGRSSVHASVSNLQKLFNLEVMCGNPHGLLRRVLESVDHVEVAGAMARAGALRTWAPAYLDACEASQAKQEAEEQKRKEKLRQLRLQPGDGGQQEKSKKVMMSNWKFITIELHLKCTTRGRNLESHTFF